MNYSQSLCPNQGKSLFSCLLLIIFACFGTVFVYANAGFLEVGRRKNYYTGRDGQVYDALTLAKIESGQP